MHNLVVLGATGTVGRNTLDVARRHADKLTVIALTAHRDVEGLAVLCREFLPRVAVVADAAAAQALRERLSGMVIDIAHGAQALADAAGLPEAQQVMSAIVGAAGLVPTLAAVRAGKRVLIANKEPLVMAGALLMAEAQKSGAEIIPVDSEHNAIFQCLPHGARCGETARGVRRLVLTASGGPFREFTAEQMARVTPAQAVKHPNWVMGPKISVDSASLMNKGLELIEAHILYRLPPQQLDVVIHPESIVHSLVEYVDGSLLAQLSSPDMRVPIAHALAHPQRWESGAAPLDLAALARLNFSAPDETRFPCLTLARQALAAGGNAPNVLNAANEVAVEAFLAGRLGFGEIAQLIEHCLSAAEMPHARDLEAILAVDGQARQVAARRLQSSERRVARV
ncbi:MAG TPA: 1-deoxy-D-xylulose-5-phosphate reductoisomerase [Nevskiaceae bacterium]|nr:1-deoxy-D-xylulose-5-phosphate reductoisomerase [Nevskiaceae bacterium]